MCFHSSVINLFGCSFAQCAVWSVVVVDFLEFIELLLEFCESVCWFSAAQSFFQCLVEAFDFALGLRMVGLAVLLNDSKLCQEVFKRVFAFGEASSVNNPVVGECGLGRPVFVDVCRECFNNYGAGDAVIGRDGK